MIRFVGGKSRLGQQIADVLITLYNGGPYVEPFFGGGGMAKYTQFAKPRIAFDIDENLIELYRAIKGGWLPPQHLNEFDYKALKHSPQSPLRTYAGYACSFGGKWFGGYARDATGKRDLTNESYKRILREREFIDDIEFYVSDYKDLEIPENSLVYCDPPYANTLGYGHTFKHEEFWEVVRGWSRHSIVVVSEYEAPRDFEVLWEKSRKTYMHHKATDKENIERLFIYRN